MRERLRREYALAGYDVVSAEAGAPHDLEVRFDGRPVHLFVVGSDAVDGTLARRVGSCRDLARRLGATAWVAVPDAAVDRARPLTNTGAVEGPRLCTYSRNDGGYALAWF